MTDDEQDTCPATNREGEQCGLSAGWGVEGATSGPCKFHGGATPTKDENPNQGAPENNGNAVKHNLSSQRDKLYERLSETKKQHVDQVEKALLDRYEELNGREPDYADACDCYELAMSAIQRQFARDYMADQMDETGNPLLEKAEIELDDGATMTVEQAHQIVDTMTDLAREARLMKKDMGMFRDPETKKAEATADIAKLWEADLTGENDP